MKQNWMTPSTSKLFLPKDPGELFAAESLRPASNSLVISARQS